MDDKEIPIAEFTRRGDRMRAALRERRLDAAIVTRPENVYYLSNFRASSIAAWTARFHALVVPALAPPRLLARALEAGSAAMQWTDDPMLWADHEDPYARVAAALLGSREAPGALRVGVENGRLTVSQLDDLVRVLPGAEFVDITGCVEQLAAELSEPEVDCMRRAAAVTELGMRTALGLIEVGGYPYEVVGAAHQAMYAAGQTDFEKSFVAVWSGPRGGMMHDTRTTQPFAPGDIATVEIMGVDRHYKACAQTSVLLPSDTGPAPEVLEARRLVAAMHDAARAVVRAGVTAGAVFDAANAIYRESLGEDYFRRVGGSLGLTMFALDLVRGSEVVLPAGTPLLVQTLVTEPVLLTCASTMIVTEAGFEQLTSSVV
jgi:Xaa-Pro dipeptidase